MMDQVMPEQSGGDGAGNMVMTLKSKVKIGEYITLQGKVEICH